MIPGYSLADDIGLFFTSWAATNCVILDAERKIVDNKLQISGRRRLYVDGSVVEITFLITFLITESQLLLYSLELFADEEVNFLPEVYFLELHQCEKPVDVKKGRKYLTIESEFEFLSLLMGYDLLARELKFTPFFT